MLGEGEQMKCYECKTLGVIRPDNKVYCRALEMSFPADADCCLTAKVAEEAYRITRYRLNSYKERAADAKELLDGLYDWQMEQLKRGEGER